jgi:arylsulfatase
LTAIRVQHLKVVFLEQQHTGIDVWRGGFTTLRIPKAFNLRADPFGRGDEGVFPMATSQMFFFVPAQAAVVQWLETFKAFPPRQRPASFNLDEVMRKLMPTQ